VQDSDPQATPPDFQRLIQDTLDSLPPDLRERISNVEVVVEDEPPTGQRLLGLYQGVPLTRRGSNYSGALPDKITIYRRPSNASTDTTRNCSASRSDTSCCTKSHTTSASATKG
jgi:predicted Zn-dependent protease with MMP-like domain